MAILKYIDGIPLYSTIGEALQYAANTGLDGYHTHVYDMTVTSIYGGSTTQSITGYMGGSTHQQSTPLQLTDTTVTKNIRALTMDKSSLSATQTSRRFAVEGDSGATFDLWVINELNEYYDFDNRSFVDDSSKRLSRKIIGSSGSYNGTIVFPAITDDDHYYVYILADSSSNTKFGGKLLYRSIKIEQFADTTITYTLLHSSGTVTEPSAITATEPRNSVRSIDSKIFSTIDWTVTTSSLLSLIRQPIIDDFETTTTKDVVGATSSSTTIILDSIDKLLVGMEISGSGVSGTPTISAINPPTTEDEIAADIYTVDQSSKDSKKLTLSTAQSISDGTTLTFTGFGSNATESIYNTSFKIVDKTTELPNFKCVVTDKSTTTTGSVSASTTVPVSSVAGLKAKQDQDVNGTFSETSRITLDSISGLWVGQSLVAISSGNINSRPRIVEIIESDKVVVFDGELTLADGVTLTFANSIVEGIGIINDSDYPNIPTYIVSIASLNLTVNTAQTLESGITLTFPGTATSANITGTINTTDVGTTSFTTTLNLNNILAIG
jgi:hypothetical protein